MNVTPELKELAMGFIAAQMIEIQAEKSGRSPKDIFRDFRRSNTMEMLFDPETGVWESGPAYLADEWALELAGR